MSQNYCVAARVFFHVEAESEIDAIRETEGQIEAIQFSFEGVAGDEARLVGFDHPEINAHDDDPDTDPQNRLFEELSEATAEESTNV